jgi:2,3-bisphosphoglycerate-independent phosphoglycerate mutase
MVTVKFGNWSLGFGSNVDGDRKRPLVLLILDGWGHSERRHGNAIALANTPNLDRISAKYPGTILAASGNRVGLTEESPGNPEIGHLNIGTGRAIKSKRMRIDEAIADGSFSENPVLNKAFKKVRKRNSAIHFVGLLSASSVHASTETLFCLLRMAKKYGLDGNVFVHGILDGVDIEPRSADIYVEAMQIKLADIGIGKIATLCGRQYAMDNTQNWQRTARAYTMLAHSEGVHADDPIDAVRDSVLRGLTDEFVQPIIIRRNDKKPVASIRDNDVVIFFNHRGQEIKQLVRAVAESETDQPSAFPKPKVDVVCMTDYDPELNAPVAFPATEEENVLADVFASHNIANGRFGQSDRLEHLTYFFNGLDESEQEGEIRDIVPSDEINAAERPEMGSFKIADRVLRAIEKGDKDVFIVNFSAADTAARSGSLEKTIQAVQFVDTCLGGIIDKVRERGGATIVTSDHGNCEDMSLNGSAPTLFTSNPVPFFVVADNVNGLKLRRDGALEDVAPTILGILGIEKPEEMTGNDLRLK